MKKKFSTQDYRELFSELRQIRALRLSRKNKIHSNIKRQAGRKRLEEFVEEFWDGGYVYLENGDYLYVPSIMEIGDPARLFNPYIPEQIIPKFCRPGNVVMDIGANAGEWTLQMAKMVGNTGRVFSIDPLPSMNQAIKKTVAINNLSQVSISQYAISNKIGSSKLTIPFNKEDQAKSGWSQLVSDEQFNSPEELALEIYPHVKEVVKTKTIEVKTVTLDYFVSEKNITKLDFIKIDVERHERLAIEGGRQTLKNFKPSLILETGSEKTKEDREIIADQLRTTGYEIIGIVLRDGVIEVTWPQYIEMKEPFAPPNTVNVLFLPQAIS